MIAAMAPREISTAPGLDPDAPAALPPSLETPPGPSGPVYGASVASAKVPVDVAMVLVSSCLLLADVRERRGMKAVYLGDWALLLHKIVPDNMERSQSPSGEKRRPLEQTLRYIGKFP